MTSNAARPPVGAAASRLEQVLQAVGGLVWSLTPSTTQLLDIVGDTRALLGRPRSQLQAVRAIDVVHPDDRPHVRHALDTLGTPDGGNLTCRILRADGQVRWLRNTLTPIFDDRGHVVRIDGVSTDITDRIEQDDELRGTAALLERINTATRVGGWELDLDAGTAAWTRMTRDILALPASTQPSPTVLWDRIDRHDRAPLTAALDRCVTTGEPWDLQVRVVVGDGTRWVRLLGRRTPGPGHRRLFGAIQDIDEQVRSAQALRASEQRLTLVLKGANDGWWDWDIATGGVHLAPRWFEMIGLEPDDRPVGPSRLLEVVHPDDRSALEATFAAALAGQLTSIELEVRLQHVAGHDVPVLVRGYVLHDPDPVRISGSNVDLTALKLAEARQAALYRDLQRANAELERQATVDALTGIANRRRFDTFLAEVWERAQVGNLPVGLILCDIDHFKLYNDHHGHPAGDRCLTEVADAIRTAVRGVGDLVARYGGEEFAIILPGTLPADAVRVAQRVRDELARRDLAHPHSPVAPRVTMSVGVACLRPAPDEWSQTLITRADDALLHAKQAGRDRIAVESGTSVRLLTREAG